MGFSVIQYAFSSNVSPRVRPLVAGSSAAMVGGSSAAMVEELCQNNKNVAMVRLKKCNASVPRYENHLLQPLAVIIGAQ